MATRWRRLPVHNIGRRNAGSLDPEAVATVLRTFSSWTAWTPVVVVTGDVCENGWSVHENSGTGPVGRDTAAKPCLPRLLLGFGETWSGGPSEGDRRPDSVPESQQQGKFTLSQKSSVTHEISEINTTWCLQIFKYRYSLYKCLVVSSYMAWFILAQ